MTEIVVSNWHHGTETFYDTPKSRIVITLLNMERIEGYERENERLRKENQELYERVEASLERLGVAVEMFVDGAT